MIKIVSGIVLFIVIVYGALSGISVMNAKEDEIVDQSADVIIEALLAEAAQNTPMVINDEIRLDRVKKNGIEIVFENTITSLNSNEVSPDEVKAIYFPLMLESLCLNKNIAIALSKGVIFKYTYQGKDEGYVTEYRIDKNSCDAPA